MDDYFKKSADIISFFFEKKAFKDGKLIKPKSYAINKIGHGLHEKNLFFKSITHSKKAYEITKALKIANPVVVQSMAILKPPEIGG